jgi:class 3 adenylate cyclase
MKRTLLAALAIGAIAAALVVVFQKSGLFRAPEAILGGAIYGTRPNDGISVGNYLFAGGLAFAVGWVMLAVDEIRRRGVMLLVLIAELIGAAAVLSMADIFFQPLPAILAATLAASLAAGLNATTAARQRRIMAALFEGRLSQAEIDRLLEGELPDLSDAKVRDVSFVFCEIANQSDLINGLSATACTQVTREFIACATSVFLNEGGYLHAADGEGIRVLFGFPNATGNHAAAAARASLAFRRRFNSEAAQKADSLGKIDLRIGISSGEVVATFRENARGDEIVVAGEPLELARRLALANQVYGSRILLGPRTFSGASKEIVARPIDFLRSTDVDERLEVYEPLARTEDATPDQLARRDRFWTAIVYFRERRWNEAFAEFSRARGDNGELDEPIQWYLGRLEPLLLRMTTEPAPVVEPLSPL